MWRPAVLADFIANSVPFPEEDRKGSDMDNHIYIFQFVIECPLTALDSIRIEVYTSR